MNASATIFFKMNISEKIRTLAGEGLTIAEIARRLNIRYQHAYNVLRNSARNTSQPDRAKASPKSSITTKPPLMVETLISGGFEFSAQWILSGTGGLIADRPLPKEVGVYAFAKAGLVAYVGVATMGIAKRLYFYGNPGATQRTSQRINTILKQELQALSRIEIYTALPADLEWNGLPVHGSAGLELGLIKKFSLPWNLRGAR